VFHWAIFSEEITLSRNNVSEVRESQATLSSVQIELMLELVPALLGRFTR